tara:strand:- start:4637 stop:6373 length:1737 start_codon:yes stop_codon:yes gene_type:complete
MRISLNLFGHVPVEESNAESVFVTSTTPSQSIRDILSDGTVFHFIRRLNLKLVIVALCDQNCEEYKTIKSFEEDADEFIEVSSSDALIDEIMKLKDDDNICICAFFASYLWNTEPNDVKFVKQKFSQRLDQLKLVTSNFKNVFIGYSSCKYENGSWIPAISSICVTDCENQFEIANTSFCMKNFLSFLLRDTSEERSGIGSNIADLYGGRDDAAIIVCPDKNSIIFRAFIKGVKYEIKKVVDLVHKDFAQWYSDFEMILVEEKEPFDWRSSEIANDVRDLVQDLVFEYMRCHRDLDEFFTDAKVNEVEMSLLEYASDMQNKDENATIEAEENHVVEQTKIDISENEEVKQVEVVLKHDEGVADVADESVADKNVVDDSLADESVENVANNSVANDSIASVEEDEVREKNTKEMQQEIVPEENMSQQISNTLNDWKQTLKTHVCDKFNITNLNKFDILLNYLQERLPYTIIVGSNGDAQALQGALPPQLLQSLMKGSSSINLPLFDGTMVPLYGDSSNIKIGGMTLDMSSMFSVDQVIIYSTKRKTEYEDIMKSKTNNVRGSVTRFTRKIELARLLSKR